MANDKKFRVKNGIVSSGDVDVTGNIIVTGTVDGRDIAALGSKLDGIETGADVTDFTNVQASGALMDSELTNEAAIKAINQQLTTTSAPTFSAVTLNNIRQSANNSSIAMYGATSANDGANISAYGSNHATFPGLMIIEGDDLRLRTIDNTNYMIATKAGTTVDFYKNLTSTGTVDNKKHFLSVAAASTWLSTNTPTVGARFTIYNTNAPRSVLEYEYVGTGSHFSDSNFDGCIPIGTITPEHFFAVGNGTTADTAAIQSAIDYLYSIGGGTLHASSGANYYINTNLFIKRGVSFLGPVESNLVPGMTTVPATGNSAADDFTAGLVIDDSTEYVQNGANYYRPKPELLPFTTTSTFDSNQWIDIIAENGGLTTHRVSLTFENIKGKLLVSSTASIYMDGSSVLKGFHVHRYGLSYHLSVDTGMAGTAIKIVEGGTKVENNIITGFNLAIEGLGGSRGYINDCQIDCRNGIKMHGIWDVVYIRGVHCWPFITVGNTSGGDDLLRGGIAFDIDKADWLIISDSFSYGYTTGFDLSGNSIRLNSCGADNFNTAPASGSVGFKISEATRTRMVNCNSAGHQHSAVRVNNTTGQLFQIVGLTVWGSTTSGVYIDAGTVTMADSQIVGPTNGVYVAATAAKFTDAGGNIYQVTNDITTSGTLDTSYVQLGPAITNKTIGTSRVNIASGTFSLRGVATAATTNLPTEGQYFQMSGNTGITGLAGGWAGRVVTLVFTSNPVITHNAGGATTNIRLNGATNFSTNAGSTLTLIHNGTQWYEVSRST